MTRVVPQQGTEDSWAPARRDEASFLAQAGRSKNLTDLRRGLVLDLNPIATAKLDGLPRRRADGATTRRAPSSA